MSDLFDQFKSDFLDSNLSYLIPYGFSGDILINDVEKEKFEFQSRVKYSLGGNYRLLSFYINVTSYLVKIIQNIIDNIDQYKERAKEVKVTENLKAEKVIGEGEILFSNLIYFYVENELSDVDEHELINYCNGKNLKIRIRSLEYSNLPKDIKNQPAFSSNVQEYLKASVQHPLTIHNIKVDDYSKLIEQGESSTLEFKSTLRINIKAGNMIDKKMEQMVLKTLAAFLNSEGGTLIIGIDDNKNILGLELDLKSFNKANNIDEFHKHFDNLIQCHLGDRLQRYLKISLPKIEKKLICVVIIKGKSSGPVFFRDEKGHEMFYIRRFASTIDLKPSEAHTYIKDHWS